MATTQELQTPQALGEPGEPCEGCRLPMAVDQRYCLNCGRRRGGPRADFAPQLLGSRNGGHVPPPTPTSSQAGRDATPLMAVGAMAALGIMLVIGVLLGKDSGGGKASIPAPVVHVSGGGTGTGATGAQNTAGTGTTGAFKSDWPAGKTGFTVELGALPKKGTTPDQIAKQKSQATSKGAPKVGALDSDQFASLPPANYIIYSGVFDAEAQATAALKPLKAKFPQAKVVKVSTDSGLLSGGNKNGTVQASTKDLQQLNNQSGASYEKALKKLPKNIVTPGAPPPVDNKPAGAGSGSVSIK